MRVHLPALILALGAAAVPTPARAQERLEFPAVAPESVGVSAAALERLDAVVRGYVERDEAVGAELLVIQGRKTVWHRAHGWADRESGRKLEPGTIQCIRSMTKPFVGTAIRMLVDDGVIELDDAVHEFLPDFASGTHRAITVAQLLEHRSGLPLSSLPGVDLDTLRGVQDVGALAAKAALAFPPGSSLQYSDDGTDTLAAIVEKASGKPIHEFLRERILAPLGLRDTLPLVLEDDPHAARMAVAYAGSPGDWRSFWRPGDAPLFPCFLGSQSMYSTCEDYARFLCLWADGGLVGERRLLSAEGVARALRPRSPMGFPAGFTGLRTWYGQLWMLAAPEGETAPETPVAFGHGGSDGTLAWMWPERDLIVLYFTQSRGGTSVAAIGAEIDRLLIRGDLAERPVVARDLAPLAGIYWSDELGLYWAVLPDGAKLRVEMPGKSAATLVHAGGEDPYAWTFEHNPAMTATFAGEPGGPARAITQKRADGTVREWTRLEPAPDLPTAAEVAAGVRAAHGMDGLAGPDRRGALRREGTFEAFGSRSPLVSLLSARSSRTDLEIRGAAVRALCRDGRMWLRSGDAPPEELDGHAATTALMEEPQVLYGGWDALGAEVRVLRRAADAGRPVLLVRVVPAGGRGETLLVDEATWRVVGQDRLVDMPGLGAIGQTLRYDDFTEVGGAVLPSRIRGAYAADFLGTTAIDIERVKRVEADESVFSFEAD